MDVDKILNDKTIKAKEKVAAISKLLLSDSIAI